MAARKNSLVGNINRRKKAGKSRPKSRSTVSREAYADMRAGWPRKTAKKKRSTKARKPTKARTGSRKRSTRAAPARSR